MSILLSCLTVFTWVALLFAAVMILVNCLIAKRRSRLMAIIRIGITVASALIAIPLSQPIAQTLTDRLHQWLMPTLAANADGVDFEAILSSLSSAEEGVRVLMSLCIAPFVFLLAFILVHTLLSILASVVMSFVPSLKRQPGKHRATAVSLGAVNGLLITMIVLVPLCGFITLGGSLLNTVADTAKACDSPTVNDLMDELDCDPDTLARLGKEMKNNPVVLAVHSTVGRPIFDSLTTEKATLTVGSTAQPSGKLALNKRVTALSEQTKTGATSFRLNLEQELGGLVSSGLHTLNVLDSIQKEDYTEADKNKLFALEESLFSSPWRTAVATDLLTSAASAWLRGETYAGLEIPAMDTSIKPIFNCMLDIVVEQTPQTLEEDLHDLLDVMGDFLVHDLLSESVDPQELIRVLSENDLINSTISKLNENPRLAPIATEIQSTVMHLVTDMLGLDKLKNGEYDDLMNTVADELTQVLSMSPEERHEVIADALQTAFEEYGFEVPADAAIQVADKAIDELGADGSITSDELTNYLIEHTDDAADLIPEDAVDSIPTP